MSALRFVFKIFSMIFLTIYKNSYYKVIVSTGSEKLAGWVQFFNSLKNAGRLGAGFISVCFNFFF